MKAQLTLALGNKKLVLDGEGDSKTIIKAFGFWCNLPSKCGACNSTNIGLHHKAPKGNDYYGMRCNDCTAELNFGQNKTGGSMFMRADAKWEKWSGGHDEDAKEAKRDPYENYNNKENIPF